MILVQGSLIYAISFLTMDTLGKANGAIDAEHVDATPTFKIMGPRDEADLCFPRLHCCFELRGLYCLSIWRVCHGRSLNIVPCRQQKSRAGHNTTAGSSAGRPLDADKALVLLYLHPLSHPLSHPDQSSEPLLSSPLIYLNTIRSSCL